MPKSPTLCFRFSPFRAEGLAVEIKDLQGQLADYNMVKFQQLFLIIIINEQPLENDLQFLQLGHYKQPTEKMLEQIFLQFMQ